MAGRIFRAFGLYFDVSYISHGCGGVINYYYYFYFFRCHQYLPWMSKVKKDSFALVLYESMILSLISLTRDTPITFWMRESH